MRGGETRRRHARAWWRDEAASRACVAARRGGVTRVRGGETRRRHARAWRRGGVTRVRGGETRRRTSWSTSIATRSCTSGGGCCSSQSRCSNCSAEGAASWRRWRRWADGRSVHGGKSGGCWAALPSSAAPAPPLAQRPPPPVCSAAFARAWGAAAAPYLGVGWLMGWAETSLAVRELSRGDTEAASGSRSRSRSRGRSIWPR